MALAMASTESRERKGRGSFDSWRGREEDSVICGREHIGFESLSMLLSIGSLAWYRREGHQRHGRPGQRAYKIGRRIIRSKINDANACDDWLEFGFSGPLTVTLTCSCR
jgi:hypothetical protein